MLQCACLSSTGGKIKHRLQALLRVDGLKHMLKLVLEYIAERDRIWYLILFQI